LEFTLILINGRKCGPFETDLKAASTPQLLYALQLAFRAGVMIATKDAGVCSLISKVFSFQLKKNRRQLRQTKQR